MPFFRQLDYLTGALGSFLAWGVDLIITHKFLEPPVERDAKAEIIPCLFNATWLATTICKNASEDVGNDKDMKREQVFGGVKTKAVGGDLTSVKCAGKWLHLGISVDALSGLSLTIDELGAEDAKTLKEWMEPIATSVGAQVLVTDDADALKTVADELELEHHVCKSHVKRNT